MSEGNLFRNISKYSFGEDKNLVVPKMTTSTTADVGTSNNLKTNYIINIFNTPQQTTCAITPQARSPTPSVHSENSIECSLWTPNNQPSDVASTTSEDTEQDLTSLTWLTELRNQSLAWPDSVRPILDDDDDMDDHFAKCNVKLSKKNNSTSTFDQQNDGNSNGNNNGHGGNANNLHKNPTPSERYNSFLEKLKKDATKYELSATLYQNDSSIKPPFNYSHIIGMSIIEKGRMTLQQICSSIETKFAYFRVRKKWNNSIRHNLSLHPCFRKIDRSKNEKGKGGYWELGVDLRKCDRKRIRNRKSKLNDLNQDHSNENDIIRCAFANATEILDGDLITAMGIDQDIQHEEIVQEQLLSNDDEMLIDHQKCQTMQFCDDNDMQQTQDAQTKQQQHHHHHNHLQQQQQLQDQHQQQHLTVTVTSAGGHYDITDLATCTNPIQLQDVFITGIDDDTYGISSTVTTANAIAPSSNKMALELFPEDYSTGTIIRTTTADSGIVSISDECHPSNNCFQDSSTNDNQIQMESNIAQDCESVVVSSFLNNSPLHGPNVIVEQLPSYYTGSIVDDGSAFRPYSDGIDEAFQYLQSSEYRCDDLLDSLLDISASDY